MQKRCFSYAPEQPIACCDVCKGEIFPDDLVHLIDGFIVCPECFFDFTFDYFADKMVCGREIKEMLDTNDT